MEHVNPQKVSQERDVRFKQILNELSARPGALILLLQKAQEIYEYIPGHVIRKISEAVGISCAEIYGVITFYSQFRLKPMGKHVIRICEGTACHVNGAKGILRALEEELGIEVGDTSDDGLFTLLSVACLGCCSLSPVIMIDSETYGRLTAEKVRKIIREYKNSAQTGDKNEGN